MMATPCRSAEPAGTIAEAKKQAAQMMQTPESYVDCKPARGGFRCETPTGRCMAILTCPGTPGGSCSLDGSDCAPMVDP